MGLPQHDSRPHTLSSTGNVVFQVQGSEGEGKGGHKTNDKSPQNICLESYHCALSTTVTPAPASPHDTHEPPTVTSCVFADVHLSASNALPSALKLDNSCSSCSAWLNCPFLREAWPDQVCSHQPMRSHILGFSTVVTETGVRILLWLVAVSLTRVGALGGQELCASCAPRYFYGLAQCLAQIRCSISDFERMNNR